MMPPITSNDDAPASRAHARRGKGTHMDATASTSNLPPLWGIEGHLATAELSRPERTQRAEGAHVRPEGGASPAEQNVLGKRLFSAGIASVRRLLFQLLSTVLWTVISAQNRTRSVNPQPRIPRAPARRFEYRTYHEPEATARTEGSRKKSRNFDEQTIGSGNFAARSAACKTTIARETAAKPARPPGHCRLQAKQALCPPPPTQAA